MLKTVAKIMGVFLVFFFFVSLYNLAILYGMEYIGFGLSTAQEWQKHDYGTSWRAIGLGVANMALSLIGLLAGVLTALKVLGLTTKSGAE